MLSWCLVKCTWIRYRKGLISAAACLPVTVASRCNTIGDDADVIIVVGAAPCLLTQCLPICLCACLSLLAGKAMLITPVCLSLQWRLKVALCGRCPAGLQGRAGDRDSASGFQVVLAFSLASASASVQAASPSSGPPSHPSDHEILTVVQQSRTTRMLKAFSHCGQHVHPPVPCVCPYATTGPVLPLHTKVHLWCPREVTTTTPVTSMSHRLGGALKCSMRKGMGSSGRSPSSYSASSALLNRSSTCRVRMYTPSARQVRVLPDGLLPVGCLTVSISE